MREILEGQRYRKTGERSHARIVEAVVPKTTERSAFAILVSEGGTATSDADRSHLQSPNLHSPIPE